MPVSGQNCRRGLRSEYVFRRIIIRPRLNNNWNKMSETIIEFKDVSFAYEGSEALLKGVSISFDMGRLYKIEGSSGCGKSTFLRLINRLENPFSGEIHFKGRSVVDYPPTALRQSILYIQQVPQVMDMSVRDNLLLPFTFNSNKHNLRPNDSRLTGLMQALLLNDVDLNDPAQTLSIGQQQRICFIRGLLLSPAVMLLDEPTSALDADSCRIVQEMAENLCRERGITVLMVSHRDTQTCSLEAVTITMAHGRLTPMEDA